VGEPVRRLISAQPDTDDAVRARQSLLRLLMQLCQHLSKVRKRAFHKGTEAMELGKSETSLEDWCFKLQMNGN
jgi:hypothetical protein